MGKVPNITGNQGAACSTIDSALAHQRLIVTCGPGGVGKTTAAAALALRGAQMGRRALVLTIDPARRLATCLGLDDLDYRPQPVAVSSLEPVGDAQAVGNLHAMMLDTRKTFDDLMRRLSPNPETAERIINSRLYGIFAGNMYGTTEYMALESLHANYDSGDFDLLILDTPPLTNALDFFRVPERATWVFDERVMRWFVPNKKPGMFSRFRPGSIVLQLLRVLAGGSLVDDITEFFEALEVVRESIKTRGTEVSSILRRSDTTYLVVTIAHETAIADAIRMEDELGGLGQRPAAFIVNRSHAEFAGSAEAPFCEALAGFDLSPSDRAALTEGWRRLAASGQGHQVRIDDLIDKVGSSRVTIVRDLDENLQDLGTLAALGEAISRGS